MNQKYVIHLAGRPCSGKSSVAEALSNQRPGVFTVDYDVIKWQLAGYQRDEHRADIGAIGLAMYTAACERGLPIILKLSAHDQATYASFREIATSRGYKFISIFLAAPSEVLLDRFRTRVAKAQAEGTKISNTDENLFKHWLAIPYFQSTEVKVFDTSKMDAAAIAAEIVKMI